MTRARDARKNYRRRLVYDAGDLTAEQVAVLFAEARACPLCGVRYGTVAQQADAPELDHVVPLVVGGAHTLANVRVICRACNLARPKDGSDVVRAVAGPVYVGPVYGGDMFAYDLQAALRAH